MVLVEEAKNPVVSCTILPKKRLKEILDDDDDDELLFPRGRKRDFKQELVKAFDAWLTECMEKMTSKP